MMDLEKQFFLDIIKCEAANPNRDPEADIFDNIEGIIEDIWDAPEAWPEYEKYFGKAPDADAVRKELTEILVNNGIEIPVKSFLRGYAPKR